jgi:plastocyanin domain-containing protein
MQMYAMSTGSFMTGALVLAFFAIGTIPGLLSIGIVTAILKGEWLKKFLAFTGVIVLGLAAFNITNGYTLLSLGLPTDIKQGVDTGNLEVQEVRMTQDDNGYSPSTLTIDAGKKIRWIITSKSPFACSSQIVAPQLGVNEKLKQ